MTLTEAIKGYITDEIMLLKKKHEVFIPQSFEQALIHNLTVRGVQWYQMGVQNEKEQK